jgi:hypothetical protein
VVAVPVPEVEPVTEVEVEVVVVAPLAAGAIEKGAENSFGAVKSFWFWPT